MAAAQEMKRTLTREHDGSSQGGRAGGSEVMNPRQEGRRGKEESCSVFKEMNSFHDIRMYQAYMMHFFWYISG